MEVKKRDDPLRHLNKIPQDQQAWEAGSSGMTVDTVEGVPIGLG